MKHKKKNFIPYVELRTNKNNWTKAIFIKFKGKGKALFKLKSGEFIIRTATKKIRWGVYSRYRTKKVSH
jgi:hypothetical protein